VAASVIATDVAARGATGGTAACQAACIFPAETGGERAGSSPRLRRVRGKLVCFRPVETLRSRARVWACRRQGRQRRIGSPGIGDQR